MGSTCAGDPSSSGRHPLTSIHIGILAPDLVHTHGWAHYSLSLIEALRRAGVELKVLAARNTPAAPFEVHPILPTVSPPDSHSLLRMIACVPRARDLLRDCDAVHALAEPYAPLAAWVAGSRPFMVTAHGSYVLKSLNRRPPVGMIYRAAFRSARMICVSSYTARVLMGAMPEAQAVVIPNAVDAARFTTLTPATPARPTVLTVGAVKARKGILELVRAAFDVRAVLPDVRFRIIGTLDAEPDYVVQVQAEITRLGLQHTVELRGRVTEGVLLDAYREASLFVLPALNIGDSFEGYGLVYLEASAAGLPVIGTRDCGAEDAIDPGVTGLLVSQAAVAQELPQAILSLLNDPVRSASMGAAGRVKAVAQTWDDTARQVIAHAQGIM